VLDPLIGTLKLQGNRPFKQ